jgi:hypothetical protein
MLQGYDIQKLEAYYKVGPSLFLHSVIMSFSMGQLRSDSGVTDTALLMMDK